MTCRTQDFQVKKNYETELQKWLLLNLCKSLTSVMVTWIHQRLVLNLPAANKTLNYFICKVDILWKTGLRLVLVEKNIWNVCCCRLELGMLTRYLWWRFCSTAAKTAWRTQPRRRPNQQAQEKRARCRWECDSGNLITNMTQKCYTSLDFI